MESPEPVVSAGHTLPSVPVRLEAILGQARATVRQWRHMPVHQSIVLDRVRGPVALRVHGHWVGTADVVVVAGQIGLRIVTLQPEEVAE